MAWRHVRRGIALIGLSVPHVEPVLNPVRGCLIRYVGGLVPDVEDSELRDKFYSFGEISSIKARPLPMLDNNRELQCA